MISIALEVHSAQASSNIIMKNNSRRSWLRSCETIQFESTHTACMITIFFCCDRNPQTTYMYEYIEFSYHECNIIRDIAAWICIVAAIAKWPSTWQTTFYDYDDK